jgi:hypothetical protein
MLPRILCSSHRLSLPLALLMAGSACGATSFSNSLTGFTGDSSQPATQAALAAAGFNVFNTADEVATVTFDSSGAHFGSFSSGDSGRNFMRTNQSDYANVNFVAEVTLVVPDLDVMPYQTGWLGLGAGDTALFGWPDWSTQFSSVMVVPEKFDDKTYYTTMYTDNDTPIFANNDVPALTSGTHRMRLTLNRDVITTTAVFSIDLNYAGGAFASDYTAPTLDVSGLYGGDGWPIEPSRIYIGGDDNAVFKDFQVTVTGAPIVFGDFNSDGNINSLDWVIFRTNQETDMSGLSLHDAYFRGDLTRDLANDHEDFVAFKFLYDAANGAGSFVALLAAVPEPSTAVLLISAGVLPIMRRAKNRR